MGDVIAFRPRAQQREAASPAVAGLAAVRKAALTGSRQAVLRAAQDFLLTLSRDFGLTVMREGLPADAAELASKLELLGAVAAQLAPEIGNRRPVAGFGVYFGHDRLGWFDDGYGEETALAVPEGIVPSELAAFISAEMRARRKGA